MPKFLHKKTRFFYVVYSALTPINDTMLLWDIGLRHTYATL